MRKSILGFVLAVFLAMYASVSAETVTDDFDDGVLAPAWEVVAQSGGASWGESAGTLNVGGSAGQSEWLAMRYN